MLTEQGARLTPQQQSTDLIWQMIDWAVRGAGAVLLLVLTLGWKDYRRQLNEINILKERVIVLETEVKHLREGRHGI